MEKVRVLLLCIAIIYCGSHSAATSTCLRSRLEHHPCSYRHPTNTAKPSNNQVGQYFTSFRRGHCQIRRRGHRVQSIQKLSTSGGSILYLYSPGKNYRTPRNYYNRNLALYNVNCSAGQYIYFQVHQMELENSKCYDVTAGLRKCIDYIQVNTAQGNTIADNCGTDLSNLDGEVFPFDSIQVIFRSNRRRAFRGFHATAQCFTRGQRSSGVAARCSGNHRLRPQTNTRSECQSASHEKIRIPYGHKIRITASVQSTSISIVNEQNNRVTIRRLGLPSISTLSSRSMDGSIVRFENNYTPIPPSPSYPIRRPNPRPPFNRFEPFRDSRQAFYRSDNTPRIPTELQGPGFLYLPKTIASSHACFQNYLVDLSSFKPTGNEKEIIQNLNRAMENLIDNDEPLDEPEADDEPSTPRPTPRVYPDDRLKEPELCGRFCQIQRHKRGISGRRTDRIDQNSLLSAVQNNNACNPILRSSSTAIVLALNRENPSELRNLRQTAQRLSQ